MNALNFIVIVYVLFNLFVMDLLCRRYAITVNHYDTNHTILLIVSLDIIIGWLITYGTVYTLRITSRP